jgi:ABC-type multidrug transport system ATPase subunit
MSPGPDDTSDIELSEQAPFRGDDLKHNFSFKGLTFKVKVPTEDSTLLNKKTEDKLILQDVGATVDSGHVLAIMGPSGAGKTTLINCLTLKAFGGETTGSATLDGLPITMDVLRRKCFVVEQQDNHWPFLTCRETLMYAAELLLSLPADERVARVNEIITKMGLDSCANTVVGNEFMQGLSGGQKRRLSIAVALIKRPQVIFLDEPTSGLDAAAAANIMIFIKELAAKENLIVIATIHQPSTKVYHGFDEVMILSGGRTAFVGFAEEATDYFSKIGYEMPGNTNPAEYFLDLVNDDFAPPEEVKAICDKWHDSDDRKKGLSRIDSSSQLSSMSDSATGGDRVNVLQQVAILFRRQSLLVMRDPMLYIGRAFVFLFSNIYFAIVYIKSRDRDQDQVLNKMWLTIWFIGVPANMGVVATYALNAEFNAIRKEVKNGMVSLFAYIFANFILQIPIMIIFAIFALGVPAYAIGAYHADNFVYMIAIFACGLYCWENFAQLFSVAFPNPLLGMMNFMGIWFSAFLFGGFLIPDDDVVWPFRAFTYILPLKYTIRALVYNEFVDSTYDACDGSENFCYNSNGNGLSTDGKEVLSSLSQIFPLFDAEDQRPADIGILLAISAFLKLSYVACKMYFVNKASAIVEK